MSKLMRPQLTVIQTEEKYGHRPGTNPNALVQPTSLTSVCVIDMFFHTENSSSFTVKAQKLQNYCTYWALEM